MKKRSLGKSGLDVSALALGRMNMTGPYGPPQDAEEMISLLHAALEHGVNFFDRAEGYGPFANAERPWRRNNANTCEYKLSFKLIHIAAPS